MSPNAQQVTASALLLPRDDRLALADRLVESLDPVDDEEFRTVWLQEALRRRADVRDGRVLTVAGAEALASTRRLFDR